MKDLMSNIEFNIGGSVKAAAILGIVAVAIYSIFAVRIVRNRKSNAGRVNGRKPYLPKVIRMGRSYGDERKSRTILFTASSTDGLLAFVLTLVMNRAIMCEHYYGFVQFFMNLSNGAEGVSNLYGAAVIGMISACWWGFLYGLMQVAQHLRAISLTRELRGYGFSPKYQQRRSFGFFLECVFGHSKQVKARTTASTPAPIEATTRKLVVDSRKLRLMATTANFMAAHRIF